MRRDLQSVEEDRPRHRRGSELHLLLRSTQGQQLVFLSVQQLQDPCDKKMRWRR